MKEPFDLFKELGKYFNPKQPLDRKKQELIRKQQDKKSKTKSK